jgi:Uma2 family endonuclease
MRYEDFLALPIDNSHVEWVDGILVVLGPHSARHQQLVTFLASFLNIYVAIRNFGHVLILPYQMRLHQPPRGREPDILFIAEANLGRITELYLDGPADLVVEIISPESNERDRGEKFYEYEMAGVREYWMIDPDRQQAEFYQLDEQGRYKLALGGDAGEYRSFVIPGLTIHVEWLWQEPLPSREAFDVLRRGYEDHD